MKNYKVEVTRKVEEIATIMVSATSPSRARVIAEHEANQADAVHFEWETGKVALPVRVKSRVIED